MLRMCRLRFPTDSVVTAVMFLLIISLWSATAMAGQEGTVGNRSSVAYKEVRPPAVAGQFYTNNPDRLEAAINTFLSTAVKPAPDAAPPLVLVSPHAGYIYSGQITADAFRQAIDHQYDLVVILGTNHTAAPCTGVSVYQGRGYGTPLGVAEIDQELARDLMQADSSFDFVPEVHTKEHSIEVQIPFVQVVYPRAKIVTAVICRPDLELCEKFGRKLARLLKNRRALVIASSDLSHFPNYADAVIADTATLSAIAAMDQLGLLQVIQKELQRAQPNLSTCACGLAPVLAAMTVAQELGSRGGRVISYVNGGDCALGDYSRVVGYGSVAFYKGGKCDVSALQRPELNPRSVSISTQDRTALLAFARRTIEQYMTTETTPIARDFSPALSCRQGAFVTLKKDHQLRGCIGHMTADKPLGQVVGAMALQAAFNDRRFSPLKPDELQDVQIEISVLTPYTAVPGPEAIRIGRDGILIRKDQKSAVFLPHVATEQGWDLEQTLEALCRKAGLAAGAWRRDMLFFTFQAIVFYEVENE